jgi:zinc protease
VRRRVLFGRTGAGLAALLMACGAALAQTAAPAGVPAHPRELTFQPLDYAPPSRAQHRQVLSNGVVVYMVEDHDLPLVNVSVLVRGGAYLDPKGKEGLASLTGAQMRAGGTKTYTAEAFDEEADFLAANLTSGMGATQGSASANFLAKDTGQALALFFEMLRTPRFQQDRLDLAKTQMLQSMERRNDATPSIEAREWERLLRGTAHFTTAESTKASIEAVTREDLVAFHERVVHPGNFVIAVAGDFKPAEMRRALEEAMSGWAAGERSADVPRPDFTPRPGLYLVDKPDANQGRVSIGHLGITRDNPDEIAVSIMNDVLGGSGFTSRITNRVRSDEGLAYSAGSSFPAGVHYDSVFVARFQSRSPSVARAVSLVLEEVDRIRHERITEEELETVKNNAIEVFPRFFASATAVAGTFAQDELTGRDPEYWNAYRDRVRAVTVDDVQRVAQKYLHPDRLVILAVGDVGTMLKGDPDRPQYSLEKLAPGAITRIPLPDPMTLVYPGS